MNIEIITTKNENLKENDILHVIASLGYTATLNECQTIKELEAIVEKKPQLVLLSVNYMVTEDGQNICLAEFFKENNINFTGSGEKTLQFDSDKVLAKSYLKDKGISTSRYFIATAGEHIRDYDIPINYPLVVKPAYAVKCQLQHKCFTVTNFSEFEKSILSLYDAYNTPVLVEEYLDGKDYLVSIIKTKEDDMLISAVEVLSSKNENVKILTNIEDPVLSSSVENLAIDAYIDLGIRDFGQIAVRTNKSGQCFFMQTNLNPDITNRNSLFIETFTTGLGLGYDEIINYILQQCSNRA